MSRGKSVLVWRGHSCPRRPRKLTASSLIVILSTLGARQEFAGQNRRRILPRLLREALRQGWQGTFGQIEFQSLHTMHRKKHHARRERLAIADLRSEIVERREVNAAQAKAERRKLENRSPEFFARIRQRGDYDRTGAEGSGGSGSLIKASAGHDEIVVCAS